MAVGREPQTFVLDFSLVINEKQIMPDPHYQIATSSKMASEKEKNGDDATACVLRRDYRDLTDCELKAAIAGQLSQEIPTHAVIFKPPVRGAH